jgi:hypothetical protein
MISLLSVPTKAPRPFLLLAYINCTKWFHCDFPIQYIMCLDQMLPALNLPSLCTCHFQISVVTVTATYQSHLPASPYFLGHISHMILPSHVTTSEGVTLAGFLESRSQPSLSTENRRDVISFWSHCQLRDKNTRPQMPNLSVIALPGPAFGGGVGESSLSVFRTDFHTQMSAESPFIITRQSHQRDSCDLINIH